MSNLSLQSFVTRVGAKNRITFGDVRRLQRNLLPNGVTSREEAELLLDLDRQAERVDQAWIEWLVSAITDFAVWVERPTGMVESEAALWLKSHLDASGTPTKAARRIAREIRREAERVAEPLASFVAEDEGHEDDVAHVAANAGEGALSLAA
jgi:hypothetical protein